MVSTATLHFMTLQVKGHVQGHENTEIVILADLLQVKTEIFVNGPSITHFEG